MRRTILTIAVAIAAAAALATAPVADAASATGFDATHNMSSPVIECTRAGTLGMSNIRVYWPTWITTPGSGYQVVYYNAVPEVWTNFGWVSLATTGNLGSQWFSNYTMANGHLNSGWWYNLTLRRLEGSTSSYAAGPSVGDVPKGYYRWKLTLIWGYDGRTAKYTTDFCQVT
jgi:hypothetical protein